MASSSSSVSDSQFCPRWKYDVFLSFRGEDTRRTFTGHLYEGLKNRGIYTFQDDKRLEQGDSISKELMKAIEQSQVALLVFSKNYATSSWCLSELVKIMECKVKNGQIVIPIFYHVDPSHVRNQSESFAEAFVKHESKYKDGDEGMQKVKAWRTALTAAAALKGYHIVDRIESECIRELVDNVSSKLCKSSSSYLPDIVGIDTHLAEVKSLLEMETKDVRILGIWGMGGVGKTTIARAIFDTLSPQFQGACFLADVKETNTNEMHSLQNILLSELLREDKKYVNDKEEGKRLMAHRLRFMKVLVVLDDINHHDHWEYLAGDLRWFGSGSRVIATTRNKQIIGIKNAIYKVTTLLEPDAIRLFNHYAFKDETPDEHTKELALEAVSHAKGLPLALKLWGIMLHNLDTTMWRGVVDMIKRESSPDIIKNLKISFEGLQDEEKTIFLDIACFFRGRRKDGTIKILESYDAYACIRFHGLIEKSLVFISEYNTIQMHDLIQDMGRYVVKIQKDSGKPTRLWSIKDFEDVMVNNMGTMAVEVMWIYYHRKLWFSKDAMKNMQRLKILSIQGYYVKGIDDSEESDGSIDYLPNNLCWFAWHGYPWKLIPQNFNPTRLVHIDLRHSSLHHLWNETKQLPSLRRLDLGHSKSLKRTPDFTGMPNLEYLNLGECTSLKEVHHSLRCSRKLITLDLYGCESLERFPYVNVESLKYLNLGSCSSLEKFPEFFGIMKSELVIQIRSSGIRVIPSSIILPQWSHLTELHLSGMPNLVSLPSSICELKDLVKLHVSKCSKLESLPEGIGDLEKLEELDAGYTLISRPPSSIIRLNKLKSLTFAKEESKDRAYFVFPEVNEGLVSLEEVDLSCCNLIDGGLPEDIGSLSSLKKLNLRGNNFEHLPRSISQLGALRYLDLSNCKRLKEFPGFTGITNLDTLDLSYCNLIYGGLPEDIGFLSSLKKLDLRGNNFKYLPQSIAQLGALQSLDLSYCKRLKELPGFMAMTNLDTLNLSYCNLIDGGLPEDIGSLSSLRVLDLSGNNFEHLPRSIAQLGALQSLDLSDCNSLKELPGFTGMTNLDTLNLSYCNSIDGGLPEDIGFLSSLKKLNLRGNNFEHLPRSISQLGALRYLDLSNCKKLKEFPGFTGMTNLDTLDLRYCNLIDGGLPEDIGSLSSLKKLNLCGNDFEHLPRSISQLGALQSLDLSYCYKLKEVPCFTGMTNLDTLDLSNSIDGGLPEDIGFLSSLKKLDLRGNNFKYLPQSIAQLGALQSLDLSYSKRLKELPGFMGMTNLDTLSLSYCNLIDGGLPEDIGCLTSLKMLVLSGNNFEHLPRSIAQLGALQSLNLSDCNSLKELPGFTGMTNLDTLNLSYCNSIDGGLPEDIGFLSSLKKLNLRGNNFEHLPRSIAQLGALQSLDLSDCKRLKELPEFPQQLDRIDADWDNDLICKSLFQNISSLQHDISASDSLSLRVFTSGSFYIPSWFHHQVEDTSVSVNLPENWYVSDNFLGFAVCYIGKSNDHITAHLDPLCDAGKSSMTQKFSLSKHDSKYGTIHFFLVPLVGLWDASKANGKMSNDYGHFRLSFSGAVVTSGIRLLYKDEATQTPLVIFHWICCCCLYKDEAEL